MTLLKHLGIVVLAGFVWMSGLEFDKAATTSGGVSFVPPALAIIGRPLTPISVAGVARRTARRTVRRCAAGVYYC